MYISFIIYIETSDDFHSQLSQLWKVVQLILLRSTLLFIILCFQMHILPPKSSSSGKIVLWQTLVGRALLATYPASFTSEQDSELCNFNVFFQLRCAEQAATVSPAHALMTVDEIFFCLQVRKPRMCWWLHLALLLKDVTLLATTRYFLQIWA